MTWEEGLRHLNRLPPSSIKMGLGRVREALARLGNPEARLAAIQVAGTNGKGSTCAITAACLAGRYRTGLYTSPHLSRVNERFQVNGVAIDDPTLGAVVAELVDRLGADHQLTYFELGTLVAFEHFRREQVDIAVLETGLGGRLDATTACRPLVTAITPIALDHMEYLGSTVAAIAGEKAGILKAGAPAVSSAQPPEALAVLERRAAELEVPLFLEGRDFAGGPDRWTGRAWRLEALPLTLKGPHQRQNLSVALACLEALAQRGFPLTPEEVRAGVGRTRWPGRFEVLPTQPPTVLDGAHNPAGVDALVGALDAEYPGRPVHLVFGVFADKDGDSMMRALFPRCAAVYLTPIDHPRSRSPQSCEALARTLGPAVELAPSVRQALDAASAAAATSGGVVVVAGSLSLIGEARAVLAPDAAPPARLGR